MIKEITFPKKEWADIKLRLDSDKIVNTIRVSNEYGKFKSGDIAQTEWGTKTEILSVKKITGGIKELEKQYEYFKELTEDMIHELSNYDNMEIITLKANVENPSKEKVYSKKVVYPELSYLVNGILFEVKKELGEYAREKQYGDLIEKKLKEKNISYQRELAIGNTGNIADFLVDNKIILELKAARLITKDNYRQIQNYLQHAKVKLGILANFREKFLKPARIIRIDSEQFS